MGKVRVARSVARAYAFLAEHLFGILGTSWLPATFFAALCAWWIGELGSEAHSIAAGSLPRAFGQTLLFLGGGALLLSSIAVPLTRSALGEESEGALAHFVIGRSELRLFLGLLRFLVVVLAALVILAVAFTLAVQGGLVHLLANALPGPKEFSPSMGEMWRGIPLRRAVADIGLAVALGAVIVVGLRFGFFLVSLAAAGEPAGLWRAARLSARNFWRLLAVSAAIGVPVVLVAGSLSFLVLGPSVRLDIAHAYGAGLLDDVLAIVGAHAVPLAIVSAGSVVLLLALAAGAFANAYRDRIEGSEEPETVRKEPAADQRDSGTPFQDAGLVPAMAKVHPLATLLPVEKTEAEAGHVHQAVAGGATEPPVLKEVAAPVDEMVNVVPELTTPIEVPAEAPAGLQPEKQPSGGTEELPAQTEEAPRDAEIVAAELPPHPEAPAQREAELAHSEV